MGGIQYTPRHSKVIGGVRNDIRRYRLQAGLSQKRLAALLGRGRSVVSSWEVGRQLPTVPNLFRLARSLNTLAEALYFELYTSFKTSGDNEHHKHGATR